VRLTDAVIERRDFRLGPLTLAVHADDRIALLGGSGTGKTTGKTTLVDAPSANST
jgi:ABC-type transport system involved in cytochrome bd biosynthesis fused ATPase/permease subunit